MPCHLSLLQPHGANRVLGAIFDAPDLRQHTVSIDEERILNVENEKEVVEEAATEEVEVEAEEGGENLNKNRNFIQTKLI